MTSPPVRSLHVALGFAAIYLIWGSTYLAIRFAIETIPGFLMAGARWLAAGLLLAALLWATGRLARPTRAELAGASLVGALLIVGGNGVVVWAQQFVPSGLAALLVAIAPLWMVLLEWARPRGVAPTLPVAVGLSFGFAGSALLVTGEGLDLSAASSVGALAVVAATMFWAVGTVASKVVPAPASPFAASTIQMLAGGGILVLAGTATGEWSAVDLEGVSARSWAAFLFLVFFGSIVALSAYVWLLRHAPVAKVATYAYVNPVVAVLLGWALAGEVLSARTLAAAAIVLVGVAIVIRFRAPPELVAEPAGPDNVAIPGKPPGP
ncbi:MAG TPA: EamA family transporter [Candidatus Thermoplasmatota archaeon]|nr:EamA family transporter [Candidatus Thermoplasmatota archaeon]